MPADTFSPFLGITLQGTGNNNNAWGDILNASAMKMLERAIAGNASHAVTGGTLALDTLVPPAGLSPALDHIHTFTGVLASAQVVQMPNVSKTWYIFNNTSGAFPFTVKTAGGAGGQIVQIPQGTGKYVICDGANGMLRLDRDAVGEFVYAATVNPGTLECTGASLLKTDYPDLYAKIGTTFGSVDGLHFTLPLLNDTGRFLRSRTGSLALGTYQANLNASHSHTVTGTPAVGTLTTDSQGAHVHTITDPGHAHTTNAALSGAATIQTVGGGQNTVGPGATVNSNTTGISINSAGAHTHNVTGSLTLGSLATATSGGAEARPEALAVIISIRI